MASSARPRRSLPPAPAAAPVISVKTKTASNSHTGLQHLEQSLKANPPKLKKLPSEQTKAKTTAKKDVENLKDKEKDVGCPHSQNFRLADVKGQLLDPRKWNCQGSDHSSSSFPLSF